MHRRAPFCASTLIAASIRPFQPAAVRAFPASFTCSNSFGHAGNSSHRFASRSAVPHSARRMSASARPQTQARFAKGTDPAAAEPALAALTTRPEGKWTLSADGSALERTLRFKTFKAAWAFMQATATACARARHHPEWSNVYNTVFVRWTTHSPPGLSDKDLAMARACDEAAAQEGEIVAVAAEGQEQGDAVARGLADTVAGAAGDCCVPKGKGATGRAAEKARVEKEEGEAVGSLAGMGGQPS